MSDALSGKVLLVEDDPSILKLYSEPFIKANYEVDTAAKGTEGLAKILQGGYDFVLLDIMLPDIDGLAILKKVKSEKDNPNYYGGPIIIMSQLEEPQIINQAIQSGAKGYLVKGSFAPEDIVNKVSEIIQRD